MKRFAAIILAMLMLLALGCGSDGKGKDADDPNLGVYTAKTMTYSGFTLDVTSLFDEGFTIELKPNGKCTLKVDGDSANGKWTLSGTDFTVKGGGIDCTGTLENGVINLQYDEETIITLVNPDYKAPAPAANTAETSSAGSSDQKPEQNTQNTQSASSGSETAQGGSEPAAVLSEEYWLVTYSFTDGNGNVNSFEAKDAGDMVKTYLKLNPDHSAEFAIAGSDPIDMQWTDDGRLTIGGEGYSMDYATFTRVDENSVDVQMQTVTYHLERKAAEGAAPAKTEQPQAQTATAEPTAEPTATPVTETRSGEPWGDSDGVISHEKLAGLYRWLSGMSSEFRKALTFDDVGEVVGKQGFDKKDGDGKYHAAYWTDGGKYYVTITFYNRDGAWTVGSISTGMNSSEYSVADISSFPVVGNRKAGSSPVSRVEQEAKVGYTSAKVVVSADLPTENWFQTLSSSSVRFNNAPTEKSVNSNSPGIRVECKESLEKIDFYKEKFENLKELDPWTISGVQMKGRSYKYIGMEWVEYYGQIADGVWASVTLTGVDPYPGSEAEAILNSISIKVK